jgi:trimeric autotransporter adhesin
MNQAYKIDTKNMKQYTSMLFMLILVFNLKAQIGINTTSPHQSAALDISSNTKGLLMPRMTLTQRNTIASPAIGLTIYQTNGIPGIYVYVGFWRKVDIATNLLADNDGDTKINTEQNGDEDKIRFHLSGTELLRMENNASNQFRIITSSNLNNTYNGISSGMGNLIGVNNTAIGDSSLRSANSSNNTAIGRRSLSTLTSGSDNTAVGNSTLKTNVFGSKNTAVGNNVLSINTAGQNTAVGIDAMANSTGGGFNTALGYKTLYTVSNGMNNTAVGFKSLFSNTTGSNNTGVGYLTLNKNTTGNENTAVGNYALRLNIGGSNNTAFGYNALTSLTTGSFNTAVGLKALEKLATGLHNSACGVFALKNLMTGLHNTAFGYNALSQGTNFNYNTALGNNALLSNAGNYNTSIGFDALRNNTTGNKNTAIGYASLKSNTTGSSNTAIGALADVGSSNLQNTTAIGFRAIVQKSNSLILGNVVGENGATEETSVLFNFYDLRPDAVVDLFGFKKGLLIPRMSTIQKDAIASPAEALMIYNTTTHSPWIYNGQLWEDFNAPIGHIGATEGDGIIYDNSILKPGYCAGISDADNDSVVDLNFGSNTPGPGDFRVRLRGTRVFQLSTSNSSDYVSQLSLDNEDISTYIGQNAGLNHNVGNYNFGIGESTLKLLTNGTKNIAFGNYALKSLSEGDNNIAIGYNSLSSLSSSAINNIAIGVDALNSVVVANTNIAIGYHALNNYTYNSSNIGIGAYTEIEAANSIAIGARAKAIDDFSIVLGSSDGVNGAFDDVKVGIGTSAPIGRLHIKSNLSQGDGGACLQLEDADNNNVKIGFGITNESKKWDIITRTQNTGGTSFVTFALRNSSDVMKVVGNGNVEITGNFSQNSDRKLKDNIVPITASLDKINRLNGYNYYWKNINADKKLQYGVIAQEVEKVFPALVSKDNDGYKSVNYNGLTAVLLASVKELSIKLKKQEDIILKLESQLTELEND